MTLKRDINWIDAYRRSRYLILSSTQPGIEPLISELSQPMPTDIYQALFTDQVLNDLFPADRSDDFFEALYGDSEEGAYDINLTYGGFSPTGNTLLFLLNLTERPGKCLACHLTQGLPEVFARHPIINIAGLVAKIDEHLGELAACGKWHLDPTRTISRHLYAVPLSIELV